MATTNYDRSVIAFITTNDKTTLYEGSLHQLIHYPESSYLEMSMKAVDTFEINPDSVNKFIYDPVTNTVETWQEKSLSKSPQYSVGDKVLVRGNPDRIYRISSVYIGDNNQYYYVLNDYDPILGKTYRLIYNDYGMDHLVKLELIEE